MRRALFSVLVAIPALAGCDLSYSETVVQLRDPSRVSVSTRAGTGADATPHEILPANATPVVVPVGTGTFVTGELSRATYDVAAARESDGSVAFHWHSTASLSTGEIFIMVPPSGTLRFDEIDLAAVAPPSVLAQPSYSLDACSELTPRASRYGGYTGVPIALEPCTGAVALRVTLETPWDNVVAIKQTTSHMRGLADLGIVFSTLTFGLPGAILLASSFGDSSSGPGANVPRVLGATFLATSLLVDLLFVPTLVAQDSTTTAYPRAAP